MKTVQIIFLSAFLILLVGTGIQFSLHKIGGEEPPVLGKAPKFELTDSNSRRLSHRDLRGKIWVVNFFFSKCQGICPAVNGSIASIYRDFLSEENVRFVSITVDPEHDTPEVLAEYGARFGADPSRWHFLTGDEPEISALVGVGFKLSMTSDITAHTTRVVLVDEKRNVRGYYRALDDESLEDLKRDLSRLL